MANGEFWGSVFDAVQSQGKSPPPTDPKSPSDVYFANLNKVDQDQVDPTQWYLMFDMVPAEAMLLGFSDKSGDGTPPPLLPTIVFHAAAVLQSNVYSVLGLDSNDEPAEGSWYVLYLQPGGDPKTDVAGELYAPDFDFGAGPTYKTWRIAAAELMYLPTQKGPDVILGLPPTSGLQGKPTGKTPQTYGRVKTQVGIRKAWRFKGFKRRRAIVPLRVLPVPPPPPPPPPPPGSGAIGVMDVGQGGCNLIFDRNLEPILYYDVGYPLGFFRSSLPATMRADQPGTFLGPIYQNNANNLSVLLSHWDWDHWRLGAYTSGGGASLGQRPWVAPQQPMSPTAANFVNGHGNMVLVPAGTPPQLIANGMIFFKNVPPMGANHAMLVNNSGLSLRIPVDLAAGVASSVLLTGDGNFNGLPGPAWANLTGIGAVHHGSAAHGAAANLPPNAAAGTGYIAYSYGINANGNHAYGFPAAAAVAAYRGPPATWRAPTEQGTAEGANLNVGPVAHGNIRMGNQGALNVAYQNSAFFAVGHALP